MGRAFSTRAPVAGHAAFSPTHPPPETPASQGCPGRGTMSEFQKRAVSQAQDTHRPISKLGQAEATVQGAGLATQDTRCTGHRQATDVGTRRLSWGVRESGRCSGQEKTHLGRDGQATSTVLPHPQASRDTASLPAWPTRPRCPLKAEATTAHTAVLPQGPRGRPARPGLTGSGAPGSRPPPGPCHRAPACRAASRDPP